MSFPFTWLTKAKELGLLHYLPIAYDENRWVYAFPKGISASETQTLRFWTQVTDSNSYDDMYYSKSVTFNK